jgi:XisH protein
MRKVAKSQGFRLQCQRCCGSGDSSMPQYDAHHKTVKCALEKDGWTITHDPFIISVGRRRLLADLGAEKMMDLPRATQKVVIEIKVLGGDSLVNDLHRAIGQY